MDLSKKKKKKQSILRVSIYSLFYVSVYEEYLCIILNVRVTRFPKTGSMFFIFRLYILFFKTGWIDLPGRGYGWRRRVVA